MKRQVIFTLFLVLLTSGIFSETIKRVSRSNQVWLGDVAKVKLNDRWSVYIDIGARRTQWIEKWSQLLIRPGITCSLNKRVSITAGGAYFRHFSTQPPRQEYRGWEQLLFNETYGRIVVNHRLRAEQRFNQMILNGELKNAYNYNNRFRYQLNMLIPVNKSMLEDRIFFITLADEIMINTGKEIKYNYFDQNRASAGLGYRVNSLWSVTISYMNVFIQKNSPLTFENNDVVVLNVSHQLSFKKKDVSNKTN